MGVPGSGKGTQARKLATRYGYAHISTGDLLRALDADPHGDSEEKELLAGMKSGKLVSNNLIFKLAFREIEKNLKAGKGVILDGAIRSVEQAQEYENFFVKNNVRDEVLVVEIKLSDESSWNRLTKRKVCPSCGFILPYSPENELKKECPECGGELIVRKDDNPETIKQRIADQGNNAIGPILHHYRTQGRLITLNGEKNIDEVDQDMTQILEEKN